MTKTLIFYSGFKRDVLTPGGGGKCGSKVVFLIWRGHAVSLFGRRLFGARIWLFCAVFCPHFALLWDMSVLERQNRAKTLVLNNFLDVKKQNVTKTVVFYSGFKRDVLTPAGRGKYGAKVVFMNRPGHAVSLFGCRLFGARMG